MRFHIFPLVFFAAMADFTRAEESSQDEDCDAWCVEKVAEHEGYDIMGWTKVGAQAGALANCDEYSTVQCNPEMNNDGAAMYITTAVALLTTAIGTLAF